MRPLPPEIISIFVVVCPPFFLPVFGRKRRRCWLGRF